MAATHKYQNSLVHGVDAELELRNFFYKFSRGSPLFLPVISELALHSCSQMTFAQLISTPVLWREASVGTFALAPHSGTGENRFSQLAKILRYLGLALSHKQ